MKVAFCASECTPFVKTGGLADVCGSLPKVLAEQGVDVAVFVPKYKEIDFTEHRISKVNDFLWKLDHQEKFDVYFIDHSMFFDREGLYGDGYIDFQDNLERFSFFCSSILEACKALNFKADIFHCHDWQTALIPVFLKEKYQDDTFFENVKSILTIHNLAYQGVFPIEQFPKLGLSEKLLGMNGLEFYGKINFLKGGIVYADKVTTVSPQYAQEICTKDFGCGLDGVLLARGDEILGVLNGLDQDVWNPKTDTYLKEVYDKNSSFVNKTVNKKDLFNQLDLKFDETKPLCGFVGRLSHQKGIELIEEVIPMLVDQTYFVLQGVGGAKEREILEGLQKQFKDSVRVCIRFEEKLAHQIYAASDMFLMPSCFEPCGLSQMISLRYGTVPIVYQTGGLIDTIQEYSQTSGNGFTFDKYTVEHFSQAIEKGVELFHQKNQWVELVQRVFDCTFKWEESAKKYKDIYQCALSD